MTKTATAKAQELPVHRVANWDMSSKRRPIPRRPVPFGGGAGGFDECLCAVFMQRSRELGDCRKQSRDRKSPSFSDYPGTNAALSLCSHISSDAHRFRD